MGFLDVLGKILNPTIGGAASAIGTGLQEDRTNQNRFADARGRTLADIYGTQVGAQTGIYGSQANQQTSQYNTQQQAALQALLAGSNEGQQNAALDLNRRLFALNAPSTRAGQAVRGSMLQNLQPSTSTGGSARLQAHTPRISGGGINALGPGAREAGRLLEGGALAGLRSGDTFDPLPKTDFQGGVLKPPGILAAPSPIAAPNLPSYQGPGGLESLLGALGLAPGIIDAIKKATRNRAVPGSGVPDGDFDPYTFGGSIDTTPPVPPPGPPELTGETGGRFYTDPMNLDPFNPYTFGGRIDTTPPSGPSGGTAPGGGSWEDFDWEW